MTFLAPLQAGFADQAEVDDDTDCDKDISCGSTCLGCMALGLSCATCGWSLMPVFNQKGHACRLAAGLHMSRKGYGLKLYWV